ncbi:DUF4176 domain-containing protein [Bacillus sp. FJAT-47783]|uniref:DUF4176 domain-containing protein n=1 Tax=Bacillus sp. FJAT-47783 TaxID=2922712 RepID=UPI001FAE0998|nr:DUF4176 domain-containing protein [Bacillus sp. FJAT-47783]
MNEDLKKKLKALAMEKVEKITGSLDKEKQIEFGFMIKDFFDLFLEDLSVLQDLYRAYKKYIPSLALHTHHGELFYQNEMDVYTIQFLEKKFSVHEEAYADLLAYSIEMMRDVLPLGSVVELDPTYFNLEQQGESPVKIVITGRFIAQKGYNAYFPYTGIVYPVGLMKPGAQIHFTPSLIKKVIHHGFKDETEEAYQFLIKKEFILDKEMKSIEFSDADMKKLQEERSVIKEGDRNGIIR